MAQASILSFSFEVLGHTPDDCRNTLDEIVREILTKEGGEPWVTVKDESHMVVLDEAAHLGGNPNAAMYAATRTLLFTGPTKIGPINTRSYGDGFRPQADGEEA